MPASRIYLDNAATSWPKPPAVYEAVAGFMRDNGAPAGRSSYGDAAAAAKIVEDARQRVAALLNAGERKRIVFGFNGTDVLNLAINGLLRRGDRVVTTAAEHNSVLRPLRQWEEAGVSVARIGCDGEGVLDVEELREAVTPATRLVCVIHASNVTGAIQPVAEAIEIARENGALVLLDAAQTVGHLPIDVQEMGVDLLAASGHKGLLGPLGTGVLYVAPGVEEQMSPTRCGGTGSRSEDDRQPRMLPDMLEAGNHNTPALAGLAAAVKFVQEKTVAELRRHELSLSRRLIDGLSQIDGIRLYGPTDDERRVGVVSMTLAGYDPQEVAAMLDSGAGVQARAGLHCAPLIHERLGSKEAGGTVRLSVGPFNTEAHIDAAVEALGAIAETAPA